MTDAEIGGKIHAITNETLHRKLTLTEYMRLIRLISLLFKRKV